MLDFARSYHMDLPIHQMVVGDVCLTRKSCASCKRYGAAGRKPMKVADCTSAEHFKG
jgi:hypothetical protein